MALEAVNTAFALLQIDRVSRKILIIDAIAIGVEIEASCPTAVVANANGRNGELKASRTLPFWVL
ncbi:hypothetical protein GCM10010869_58110 [Mesorhizobium tianshanense]|uniref:Uncharacterized protein n=2 Tax=Mesorhizobium tianshanense TaxID=39844 RepID=A0A562NRD8_9HYPH|nr:hypothetical protein IQ26_03422 [Mesorhizobium tianshanense]GLS40214.1 hypothetical protein GCM10010869_58110 [Mesorhizobium tianshanense]